MEQTKENYKKEDLEKTLNTKDFENIRIENNRNVEIPPFQTAGPISIIVFFILSSLDLPAVDTNEWAMCAE